MSRIGKLPVAIPSGVTVDVKGDSVHVKGPKGKMSLDLIAGIGASVDGSELVFTRSGEDRVSRANHGLMRSLAGNMVEGVTNGFSKKLEVRGVGYRASVKGRTLVMNLGFSHLIEFPIPEGIDIDVDRDNNITVSGADKAQVGQVAANIRAYRPPDHYKGKGVRYADEYVLLKAGKA